MWSVLFWHLPRTDDEVIEVVEGTSMVLVLRRDHDAEAAQKVMDFDNVTALRRSRVSFYFWQR